MFIIFKGQKKKTKNSKTQIFILDLENKNNLQIRHEPV